MELIPFLLSLNFKSPSIFILLIPLLPLLWYLIFKRFVSFDSKIKEKEYEIFFNKKKLLRIFVLISRLAVITLLVTSLASPFVFTSVTIPGDKNVKILVDESLSFTLFDQSIRPKLEENLKKLYPTTVQVIASGTDSRLGDEILSSLSQNDNIFLFTDGQVNNGRGLSDLGFYAAALNASVNGINVNLVNQDASVYIVGPGKTVSNVENTYYAIVENPSSLPYTIVIKIDGVEILRAESSEYQIPFTNTFTEGTHEITAEILLKDKFKENNIFYKSLEVLPKPKVLFVTKEDSPMRQILDELYIVTRTLSIPNDYSEMEKHSAIILNDIPQVSNSQVELLSRYVVDGNGLIVVGGVHSFDLGEYENSFLETLLPVRVGQGEKIEGDTNIVILIDISGSTGQSFGDNSVVDVEKAQAVSILNDLRPTDKVALVAFNAEAFILTNLLDVKDNKNAMINQIERLKDGGGTVIASGIAAARSVLGSMIGSKQIVLISDGKTQAPDEALAQAREAAKQGIQLYTVAVGERTDEDHLRSLAAAGFGGFYQPDQSQRLRLAFERYDTEGKDLSEGFRLGIADTNHFITQGLEIDASVSGFNQVIPKSSSRALITTQDGHPIVTTWRFGLGRVAVISTDDGTWYAGELLSPKNSQLISKTINWGIGDLNRKREYYVDVKDTFIDQPVDILVRSAQQPESNVFSFEKIDERLYSSQFVASKTGFQKIMGKTIAVNYNSEYQKIGLSDDLENFVVSSGGMMLDYDDIETMKKLVETRSIRSKKTSKFYRWPFLLAALVIILTEVCVRRIVDNKISIENIFKPRAVR